MTGEAKTRVDVRAGPLSVDEAIAMVAHAGAGGIAIFLGTVRDTNDGRAVTKDVNPLAGLAKDQFIARMTAFRAGTRPATVMHQIAKGYTDPQIDAMAGWFAAQKR